MLDRRVLLLLFSASLCLASEETEPDVLLTKQELISIIKKIENDTNLRLHYIPSSGYLSTVGVKKFSEIVPDEWYEQVIECINNNDEYCLSATEILQRDYWKNPENQDYWKRDVRVCEYPINSDTEKDYKEDFKAGQYENFRNSMVKLYSLIQGYILGKNENKFAFVQGYMLAKNPYIAIANKNAPLSEVELPE
ncbi:MAG TPA: hypothetical protein VL201_01590 [Patescibacteria group bacterium]|jgi:hypothetical protein|nr:hypothetical protein [Patescibacteria group bacterium]